MIPFFFTRYRKAPLATCVSFISSCFYVFAILCSVGYFFNWENIKNEVSLGKALLLAAIFAAIGFGFGKLAKWLAERKQKKLAAKAGASVPTPTPAAAPVAPAAPERICPKCGAKAEPDDVFCIQCGTKLK